MFEHCVFAVYDGAEDKTTFIRRTLATNPGKHVVVATDGRGRWLWAGGFGGGR